MKKRIKKILYLLIGVPLVLLLTAHGCMFLMLSANSPLNKMSYEENIATATKWTRLPAMPDTATGVDVQVRGSVFTYEIILKFELAQEELARWLDQAKVNEKEDPWRAYGGRRKTTPFYFGGYSGREMRCYDVPQGKLYVDEANGIIIIDASWS